MTKPKPPETARLTGVIYINPVLFIQRIACALGVHQWRYDFQRTIRDCPHCPRVAHRRNPGQQPERWGSP